MGISDKGVRDNCMKQAVYEIHSRSVLSRHSLSLLTTQYSSILLTTANHWLPCWVQENSSYLHN